MTLPVFYYACGTNYVWNTPGIVIPMGGDTPINIKGLDGKTVLWEGGVPGDAFPKLLEPTLWDYERVQYPAQALLGGLSIEAGVDYIISRVTQTPIGTPFGVGGYSQGAAVASRIYNECRQGRLVDRRADLRAVVTFGNPMREKGHTFFGSSGYSGACDVPGDTRNGHGAFPTWEGNNDYFELLTSPFIQRFARLQNTEDLVWDFTMPNEVSSGMGSSTFESMFLQKLSADGLRINPLNFIASVTTAVFNGLLQKLGEWAAAAPGVPQQNGVVQVIDALTGAISYWTGGGHIMYPFYPPPNSDGSIPSDGDTCYQLAAKYLNTVGARIFDELNPTVAAPTSRAALSWFTSLPGG